MIEAKQTDVRVRKMPRGQCAYCDRHSEDEMMPSHDASPHCESSARKHCTCDTCF